MKMRTILTPVLVFVVLVTTACSTGNNQSARSSVPSQSASTPSLPSSISPLEQESRPASEGASRLEETGAFQAFAEELRNTYRDELIELLNELLNKHRNGTFIEMPNHHPGYPSDFPSASNLPEIESIDDVVIAWRETEQIDADTEKSGGIFILVPIDERHIYILEPSKFSDGENHISIGFGYSGFSNISIEDFLVQSETHRTQ